MNESFRVEFSWRRSGAVLMIWPLHGSAAHTSRGVRSSKEPARWTASAPPGDSRRDLLTENKVGQMVTKPRGLDAPREGTTKEEAATRQAASDPSIAARNHQRGDVRRSTCLEARRTSIVLQGHSHKNLLV